MNNFHCWTVYSEMSLYIVLKTSYFLEKMLVIVKGKTIERINTDCVTPKRFVNRCPERFQRDQDLLIILNRGNVET